MKWIKYKIICNENEEILLTKKIGYSSDNLVIAQQEAYNGQYTIENDGKQYDKEPLPIEFGGTNAKSAADARNSLGVIASPVNPSESKGFVYQNDNGTTNLANMLQRVTYSSNEISVGLPSYKEVRCSNSAVTKLEISSFVHNKFGVSTDLWTITFIAGSGITVKYPDNVIWANGIPSFVPGVSYYLSFVPFYDKVLGVWVAVG